MSSDGEQNGVQYVVSLPEQEKQLNLKTINLKVVGIAPTFKSKTMRNLTPIQNISSMSLKRNIDISIPALKETSKVVIPDEAKDSQNQTEELNETHNYSKRLKTNISVENLKTNIVHDSEESSEKLSDIDTEDEWDEDALEELTLSEQCQNTSTLVTTGKKKKTSRTESYCALDNSSTNIDKKKGKPKLFRMEWLNIDIFKDWLDKDPKNPSKARCIACNTTMNAGKSELEKHATGARHCQNVQIMKNQQYLEYEKEEVSDLLNNVQMSMNEGESYAGDEVQSDYRDQQLEALNRIATSMDTLSTNVALFFEKLCSNQETLIQILQQLVPK